MDKTEFVDKTMSCKDCKGNFIFSAAEQSFFQEKGLTNEPKRCANCRLLARSQKSGLKIEQTAEVNCSCCDKPTRVPFQPNGQKPVLCNACYHNGKEAETQTPSRQIPDKRELALA